MIAHTVKLGYVDASPMATRLGRALRAMKSAVTREQRRWRAADYLRTLDDNLLRDIGFHRSQIIASVQGNDIELRGANRDVD